MQEELIKDIHKATVEINKILNELCQKHKCRLSIDYDEHKKIDGSGEYDIDIMAFYSKK